jgi:hypothetical protein
METLFCSRQALNPRLIFSLVRGAAGALFGLVPWAGFSPDASAQAVLIVEKGSALPGVFDEIQQAAQVANPGDVILVRPGSYAQVSIDGKGLRIIGLPDASGALPTIRAGNDVSISWKNVPLGQSAVLRGFHEVSGSYGIDLGLAFNNCQGPVYLEDLLVDREISFSACRSAALVRVEGRGGLFMGGGRGDLYDTKINGLPGEGFTQPGGAALYLLNTEVFASGCVFQGGPGKTSGSSVVGCGSGNGGAGIQLVNSAFRGLDSVLIGGVAAGAGGGCPPGTPGLPSQLSGASSLEVLPGSAHRLHSNNPILEVSPIQLQLSGDAGELAFLYVATGLSSLYLPTWNGGFLLSLDGTLLSLGTLGALGSLSAAFGFQLSPSIPGLQLFAQPLFVHPSGTGPNYLGNANSVQLFDSSVAIYDCNQDGISDTLQIQAGQLTDCDNNGVPDLCQLTFGTGGDCNGNGVLDVCDIATGFSLDVNNDGKPDECSGLLSVPGTFPDLAAAVLAASNGDVIELAAGTYSGVGFRNIKVQGKSFLLRSVGGAATCVLDLAQAGRALDIYTPGEEIVIQGLTFLNGSVSASGGDGGAVRIQDASVLFQGCSFESCRARRGGAVFTVGAPANLGELVTVFQDCKFFDNQALNTSTSEGWGGAIFVDSGLNLLMAADLIKCELRGNSAPAGRGGAVFARGSLSVRNSLFDGNWAGLEGGALLLAGSYYSTSVFDGNGSIGVINGSTFTRNFSPKGGAVSALAKPFVAANSIFWDNYAPEFPQLRLLPGNYVPAQFVHCVIQGTSSGSQSLDALSPVGDYVQFGPGMLAVNPLFADLSGGDLHLSANSPCIDAGQPGYQALPGEQDLDGQARVQGATIDMGADERP